MRYLVSMDYFVANNPIETLSGQTVDFRVEFYSKKFIKRFR